MSSQGDTESPKLVFREKPDWPPLAWLAECIVGRPEVVVHHGARVETRSQWFCEGVWDDDFDTGEFDSTDLFFGSGARCDSYSGSLTFVSSCSTLDRLQILVDGEQYLVSNSLACLHAVSPAWLSPDYPDYGPYFGGIKKGIGQYGRVVPERGPTLVYFQNVVWDGMMIRTVPKPDPVRTFFRFEDYRDFLTGSLKRIGRNLRSHHRQHSMDTIGTVSSGYDSATVAALARVAGLSEVVTVTSSREEHKDSGVDIAERLGLKAHVVERLAWQAEPVAEISFVAADAKGEDVFFAGMEPYLRNRVMFSGYRGGIIWAKSSKATGSTLARADRSGLSLTEYRLSIGMIHVPVPYFGARNDDQIIIINQSDELKPWDVPGKYSNPICRRILEDAGIPGRLFGQKKKAASNLFISGDVAFTRAARMDYLKWRQSLLIRDPHRFSEIPPELGWIGRGYLPEIWAQTEVLLRRSARVFPEKLQRLISRVLIVVRTRINKRANSFFQWAFPWALSRLSDRYR